MSRKAKQAPPAEEATVQPVMAVIDPHAVYTRDAAQALLRLAEGTIPREIRLGRLRVSKRAGRYFILGDWLLDWLRKGELTKAKPEPAPDGPVNGQG